MVFEVEYENYYKCKGVCKDILWMYHDMIVKYGGFGHNIDFETIDYEKYFFAYTEEELEYGHIAQLLAQGSVVALCCQAVNLLDEENRDSKFYDLITKLLDYHIINDMPLEKDLLTNLKNALNEEISFTWEQQKYGSNFNKCLIKIYKSYVLGYYKGMIKVGKN